MKNSVKVAVHLFDFTGVGNMTDKAELELMATKPVEDFAFEVDGYRALPKIKNILAYKTCECRLLQYAFLRFSFNLKSLMLVCLHLFLTAILVDEQGPVIQSMVSLTSSLRSQLV